MATIESGIRELGVWLAECRWKTIREVLARLKSAGLTINTDKVQVCQPESKVLGVVISSEGVRVDPDKVGRYRK